MEEVLEMPTIVSGDAQDSSPQRVRYDFSVNLDNVPNGDKRPVELCGYLQKLRDWRADSASSKTLIR